MREGVEAGNFGVELTRSSAKVHWGFIWNPKSMEVRHERVLEKLRPNSPADEWNRLHPSMDIRTGDTLVKVNGMGGRLEVMTVELGKTHIFCEFKPLDADARVRQAAPPREGTAPVEPGHRNVRESPYPKAAPPLAPAIAPVGDRQELLSSPSLSAAPHAAAAAGEAGGAQSSTAGASPRSSRDTFKVELSRDAVTRRWGFVWDDKVMERSEARIVSKITPGSLVSEWNAAHPAQEVRVGDTLVGVNGRSGRMELLTVELSKKHVICEFSPGETRGGMTESVAAKTAAVVASALAAGSGGDRAHALQSTPRAARTESSAGGASSSTAAPRALGSGGSSSSRDKPAPFSQAALSVQPGPADAASGPPKEGHYRVELRRPSKATRWGFVWDPDVLEKQKVRVLSKVSPGTPAAEWNMSHPGQEMQPGDTLVMINGKGGRLEFHTIELNKDHIACEFRSAKPQSARGGSALIASLRAARPGSMPVGLGSEAAGRGGDADAACDAAGKASSAHSSARPTAGTAAPSARSAAGNPGPPSSAAPLMPGPSAPLPMKGRPLGAAWNGAGPLQASNTSDPSAIAASAAAAAASAAAVAASAAAAAASAVAACAGPGNVASAGDTSEDTDITCFGAVGGSAGDTYVVELRRNAPSQRWGFVWDPDILAKQKTRTVTKISPGTPAAEWNVANPGREVRTGDTLLKVNGNAGRMEIHTLEFNKNAITCEFRSASAQQAPRPRAGVLPAPTGCSLPKPPQPQPLASPVGACQKPEWWEQWPAEGGQAQSVAPAEVREAVQHIMDLGQAAFHAPQPHSGRRFEVVNVLHNQHAGLWEKYCAAHSKLRRNGGIVVAASPPLGPPVPQCMGTLDPDAGECLLFHGTKPNSAERVCLGLFGDSGVDPGPTGGVYLYEASSSADRCAQDNLEGMYAGLCAMLLCRVACGTSLSLEGLGPEEMANSLCDAALAASYDSAVSGDAAVGCREILVRDTDLVYPEYVVLYRRLGVTTAETV